jgi:hypothetical protein
VGVTAEGEYVFKVRAAGLLAAHASAGLQPHCRVAVVEQPEVAVTNADELVEELARRPRGLPTSKVTDSYFGCDADILVGGAVTAGCRASVSPDSGWLVCRCCRIIAGRGHSSTSRVLTLVDTRMCCSSEQTRTW